jgi:hypothetical protein
VAENALAKKLKLKPGHRAAFIGAPEGYLQALSPLPEGVETADKLSGKFDWVQVFVKNKAEIDRLALRALELKRLTLVSVDDTWSAFALRPYREGEAKQTFR